MVCGRDRDDSLKFKTCIRIGKKGNFKLKFEGGRWSQTGCCSIFTSQPPLGFPENIPKERKLSRERQVCGGKRLGDVRGHRSKCADWSAVMSEATGSQISTCCKRSLQNSTSERTTIPNAKDSLAPSAVTRYQTVVPNKVANEPNSNAKKQTKELLPVHSKLYTVYFVCSGHAFEISGMRL